MSTELPQWMLSRAGNTLSENFYGDGRDCSDMAEYALTAANMREALACVEALRVLHRNLENESVANKMFNEATATQPMTRHTTAGYEKRKREMLDKAKDAIAAFDATQEK